jgi:hypothetical protein
MKVVHGTAGALALIALLSLAALARQTIDLERLRALEVRWSVHTFEPTLSPAIRTRLGAKEATYPDLTFDGKPEVRFVRLVKLTVDNDAIVEMSVRVRIKNIGRGDFESDPEAQSVHIESFRGMQRAALGRLAIPNIPAGETSVTGYTTTVRWTQGLSDEFPRGIQARIGYNPDIYLDGNPKNDDSNLRNNVGQLRGRDLLTLINKYIEETRNR